MGLVKEPGHVILFIEANDLDSSDLDFKTKYVITCLEVFLSHIKQFYHLQSITVLSMVPREVFRHIYVDNYNQRVSKANNLLG